MGDSSGGEGNENSNFEASPSMAKNQGGVFGCDRSVTLGKQPYYAAESGVTPLVFSSGNSLRNLNLNSALNESDMEVIEERKRKRGLGHLVDITNHIPVNNSLQIQAHKSGADPTNTQNHFLLAGSGSPACQNP